MNDDINAREASLWSQYASSGVLPAVPSFATSSAIASAHTILAGEYNRLQMLLYGEALARMNALSDKEQFAHVEAARWVKRIANSSKRGYANKVKMSESLAQFKSNSRNGLLSLVAGLEKGAQMLKDAPEDKKVPLANSLANRLVQVLSTHPGISNAEEFVRLVISIGWTFARNNQMSRLKDVVALLPDVHFGIDDYIKSNIEKLKDKLRFIEQEPIRVWFKDVKDAETSGSSPEGWVPAMLQRAVSFTASGLHRATSSVSDSMGPFDTREPFDPRRMVLLKVTRMVGRFKNGIPTTCASAFMHILKNDGLKGFDAPYYARAKKEPKAGVQQTPNAKTEWPSLAEDIAKMIVKAGKTCFGHKRNMTTEDVPDLEWAIAFLENVYSKFSDDEWADYRLGKLFVWSGDRERGKRRVLPVVRKKQTEFWAWDLLGDLMPEKRKCCVARALACNADEKYTKAIKKEAVELGIDHLPKPELEVLLSEAEELLIVGLEPHRGILIDKFETKEGKKRLVFSAGDGTDIMPVSPKIVGLQKTHVGMPVTLYWDRVSKVPENTGYWRNRQQEVKPEAVNLVAVKPRVEGTDWDVIVPEYAVFLGVLKEKSGSTAGIYAKKNCREFLSRIKAGPFTPGDTVNAYFRDIAKDGRPRECLRITTVGHGDDGRYGQLPQVCAVYYGFSQKGTSYLLSSGQVDYNVPIDKFSVMKDMKPGDAFRLWYSTRECEDRELHKKKILNNVHRVERIEFAPNVVEHFLGRMRLPRGINGPGFVDNVYIPMNLLKPLLDVDKGLLEIFVQGKAVRLPPKRKVDKYGIVHVESQFRAFELQIVRSQALIDYIKEEESENGIEEMEYL